MADGYYRSEIPACPGYGFETTQEFSTQINELKSGVENRNGAWMYGRHRVSLSWNNIDRSSFESLRGFFYGVRGRLYAFLQRDWSDYQALDEVLGVGDGTSKDFQVGKFYTQGAGYFRPIYALDQDTFKLYLDGVLVSLDDYTLDIDRGKIKFNVAPATSKVISWSGEFFLWGRFDSDQLPVQIVDASNGDYVFTGAISIVEVKPPPAVVV